MDNFIVIGDIHGRNDLLTQLLENPEVFKRLDSGKYKAVFLGDMVDRGPDSFAVVEKIKDMCETGWAIALLGNHESMMLDFHRKRVLQSDHIWLYNGGHQTIKSYADQTKLYGISHFFDSLDESGHWAWLKTLPYFYETEEVWFSHAPIPKVRIRKDDFRTDTHALIWSFEDEPDGSWEFDHGKTAVCGHIHDLFRNNVMPRILPNIIYADTGSGCSPKGRLTAIIITDGKYDSFVQAIPI